LKSLFNTSFNWPLFLGAAIVIRLLLIGISWTSYFAILLSLHQFILLFNSIGHIIPIRYLLGAFMCVQFFIGPVLAYNGLDEYQYIHYKMRIPELQYFAYAIPAVISFILGLHFWAGKLKGEVVNEKQIEFFVNEKPSLPYWFIVIGFVASVVAGLFSEDFAFVFYWLGSFKFIGLFLLIIGGHDLKILPLILVISSIVGSSLLNGMFHDLLIWIIFTGCIFAIKYKFDFNYKIIACSVFVFLSLIIQLMKSSYRTATGIGKEAAGVETFSKLYEQENADQGLFSFARLAPSTVRINQGFIITNIMYTVPSSVPFSDGEEMYQLFEAGVLPRFMAPNKLKAGDRSIFMKYSGLKIRPGTSMGLSSLGDAYINYGLIGGCIFMFLLGAFYNSILLILYKSSQIFPVLILFTSLIFYYPIRPDCELQTILGHVFKSCFLIYLMIQFFKNSFRLSLSPAY